MLPSLNIYAQFFPLVILDGGIVKKFLLPLKEIVQ